jgi:hypothetical protein
MTHAHLFENFGLLAVTYRIADSQGHRILEHMKFFNTCVFLQDTLEQLFDISEFLVYFLGATP